VVSNRFIATRASGSGLQQSKGLGHGPVAKPTRVDKGKAVMVEVPKPSLPKPTVSKWVAVQPAFKGPGSSREKLAAGSSSPAGGSVFRVASRASSSSGVLPAIPTQCILSPFNRCSSEKSSESVAPSKAPDEEVDRWKMVGSAQNGPEMEVGSFWRFCSGWVAGLLCVCSCSGSSVTEASPVPDSVTPVLGCTGGEVGPELGKELANVPDGLLPAVLG
jgi:hypothetical protein